MLMFVLAAGNVFASPQTPSADACLPMAAPLSPQALFGSSKKVFAHYFNRFPLSIDNKPLESDYYTRNYLNPAGENNKWLAQGGYLRSRPLPVTQIKTPGIPIENMKREIRLAISRGISGFAFDILSLKDLEPGNYLPNMLSAAAAVDQRFKILLMPDMAALQRDTSKVATIVRMFYNRPELYRLPDGRLVVAPFLSESISPTAWAALKTSLEKEGFKIALYPTLLSLSDVYVGKYQVVSDGLLGTFGTPVPQQLYNIAAESLRAHTAGKLYMAGIGIQGYRPKYYIYWESEGSTAYRNGWIGAIAGSANWVQLTTWNDFSESTQVAPYTDKSGTAGTGYFNLTGYYSSWFLTGTPPPITHDVLYYFHRKESVNAPAPRAGQRTTLVQGAAGWDNIELLGFLTAPGRLSIRIGQHTYTKDVGAGVQSFVAPIEQGTPHFSLIRNGAEVISFDSDTAIAGSAGLPDGYADLTFWSGSASAKGTCYSNAIPIP
ncbi:MAG: hypothetical protein HY221_01735 [Candidatus Sungbacteria bacterium]|uniref:Glycoside hydrolase family 71 n=1 Tax=Candidatus Sungiibacteriota bacterium TaxID=2750080 RepID=A0A932VR91_9BACT|nr:hypothetical protein [Candidatus Sungbacteria bacterium]